MTMRKLGERPNARRQHVNLSSPVTDDPDAKGSGDVGALDPANADPPEPGGINPGDGEDDGPAPQPGGAGPGEEDGDGDEENQ